MPESRSAPGRVWVPQATVFVSSACIMIIELVAGRIISRHLGSSLYTWTSVIGVVLAGIALGNWLGGLIADRKAPAPTLSTLFLTSSAACLTTVLLNAHVGDWLFLWTLPWAARVGTHVAIVFLAPSVVLGMISPVAAKMALDRGRSTGRTIGSVYAWGVVGSIAGTFAAGFWLIAAFGTASVVWAVAGVLAAMGVIYGAASWRSWAWAGVLALLAIPGLGDWAWARTLGESWSLRESQDPSIILVDDSQYSYIMIRRSSQNPELREMFLDKLIHSVVDMKNPSSMQYPYERIYDAVTRVVSGGRDSLRTLTIGGGGYVFPRHVDAVWPRSRTEVVEIDPAVTHAAVAEFGLATDHDLIVYHEDGRVFLRRQVEALRTGRENVRYDLIYEDAINDYSVPYQMTTRECLELAKELLAPDGAFLMNIVDIVSSGLFLGSMVETMESVFPHVTVFVEGHWGPSTRDNRNTFILAGSQQPLDTRAVEAAHDPRSPLHEFTPVERRQLKERCRGRILTDDWAPVENLLAPVVRSSSDDMAAGRLVSEGLEELRDGRTADAIRTAQRALRFGSERASTHELMANAYFVEGALARAIEHYETAVRSSPSRAALRNNYGAALLKAGRTDAAVREFEAALRLDPSHVRARENLDRARAAR